MSSDKDRELGEEILHEQRRLLARWHEEDIKEALETERGDENIDVKQAQEAKHGMDSHPTGRARDYEDDETAGYWRRQGED